mmetsp:Transcript_45812/g.113873  ORF Transcript_45812/g.113873 Transcript_45812/m.113873 type:complete len:266 (-) Transcript_45812:1249-2046(-)
MAIRHYHGIEATLLHPPLVELAVWTPPKLQRPPEPQTHLDNPVSVPRLVTNLVPRQVRARCAIESLARVAVRAPVDVDPMVLDVEGVLSSGTMVGNDAVGALQAEVAGTAPSVVGAAGGVAAARIAPQLLLQPPHVGLLVCHLVASRLDLPLPRLVLGVEALDLPAEGVVGAREIFVGVLLSLLSRLLLLLDARQSVPLSHSHRVLLTQPLLQRLLFADLAPQLLIPHHQCGLPVREGPLPLTRVIQTALDLHTLSRVSLGLLIR